MCEFKSCRGPNACLLRESSPCPQVDQNELEDGLVVEIATRLRLRSKGFLDQDALIGALGLDEPRAEVAISADVIQIAPFHRAKSKEKRAAS